MHWSQALSRSHTQPILMPRTPPWKEKGWTEASDGVGWSRRGGTGVVTNGRGFLPSPGGGQRWGREEGFVTRRLAKKRCS